MTTRDRCAAGLQAGTLHPVFPHACTLPCLPPHVCTSLAPTQPLRFLPPPWCTAGSAVPSQPNRPSRRVRKWPILSWQRPLDHAVRRGLHPEAGDELRRCAGEGGWRQEWGAGGRASGQVWQASGGGPRQCVPISVDLTLWTLCAVPNSCLPFSCSRSCADVEGLLALPELKTVVMGSLQPVVLAGMAWHDFAWLQVGGAQPGVRVPLPLHACWRAGGGGGRGGGGGGRACLTGRRALAPCPEVLSAPCPEVPIPTGGAEAARRAADIQRAGLPAAVQGGVCCSGGSACTCAFIRGFVSFESSACSTAAAPQAAEGASARCFSGQRRLLCLGPPGAAGLLPAAQTDLPPVLRALPPTPGVRCPSAVWRAGQRCWLAVEPGADLILCVAGCDLGCIESKPCRTRRAWVAARHAHAMSPSTQPAPLTPWSPPLCTAFPEPASVLWLQATFACCTWGGGASTRRGQTLARMDDGQREGGQWGGQCETREGSRRQRGLRERGWGCVVVGWQRGAAAGGKSKGWERVLYSGGAGGRGKGGKGDRKRGEGGKCCGYECRGDRPGQPGCVR